MLVCLFAGSVVVCLLSDSPLLCVSSAIAAIIFGVAFPIGADIIPGIDHALTVLISLSKVWPSRLHQARDLFSIDRLISASRLGFALENGNLDPNKLSPGMVRLLNAASGLGQPDFVRLLLRSGAFDQGDLFSRIDESKRRVVYFGSTALVEAAISGSVEACRLLIRAGVSWTPGVTVAGKGNATAVAAAVDSRNSAAAITLLEAGADPRWDCTGNWSLAEWAVARGLGRVGRAIVHFGGAETFDFTAFLPPRGFPVSMGRALANAGAGATFGAKTADECAWLAVDASAAATQFALDLGVDPNAMDDGFTLLSSAIFGRHEQWRASAEAVVRAGGTLIRGTNPEGIEDVARLLVVATMRGMCEKVEFTMGLDPSALWGPDTPDELVGALAMMIRQAAMSEWAGHSCADIIAHRSA
jgi:hypothetical protein